MIVGWKEAIKGLLLCLLLDSLNDRMFLGRIVTFNGLVMHDAKDRNGDSDFVWKVDRPEFSFNMNAGDVVQVFNITIPFTPRRVFVVRPTAKWVEAYNREHKRFGPDALTADQFYRTLLHPGEYELKEIS